jgi:hypothetical protein
MNTAIAASAGLTLVNTTTFTTTSTVQVNNCFSSSYNNYRVLLTLTAASANGGITLQYSVSGTPSAASYYGAGFAIFSSAVSGSIGQVNTGSLTINDVSSTNPSFPANSIDIYSPNIATNTIMTNLAFGETSVNGIKATYQGGLHLIATAYDGLTIKPASGTISGTIRIYGYKNS